MAHISAFDGNAFTMASLTASINGRPYEPNFLGRLGLFTPKPITTRIAEVEKREGVLSLLTEAAYGSTSNITSSSQRKMYELRVPHVPDYRTVMAADIIDVRAFGSETEQYQLGRFVNEQLDEMNANHSATHEYHRIGAVTGVLLDGDGTTEIHDYFTKFGETQVEVDYNFLTPPGDFREIVCNPVVRAIGDALGNSTFRGVVGLCGDQYFDGLGTLDNVKEAYANSDANRWMRESLLGPDYSGAGTNGFHFGGIDFFNYRGKVGSVDYIPTGQARFFPRGARDVFIEVQSPSDMMGSARARGRRFWASQERLKHNKGVQLHTQSNVLMLCTRPKCLIKSTGTFA